MATVVGAASYPLSNPIVSMVDVVSSKAFDEVLKATPPALSAFLAGLPSIEGNLSNSYCSCACCNI
ncbi:hypothetical protein GOBAR_DD16738 [Gossypium barbadense]|nr:hypothetical protein GOBAR_DD16738 [Gossypium barbadense]